MQPFLREKPTEPSLIDANWSIEDKTGHYWRLIDCKCTYVVQCACVSVSQSVECKLSPDCVGGEL